MSHLWASHEPWPDAVEVRDEQADYLPFRPQASMPHPTATSFRWFSLVGSGEGFPSGACWAKGAYTLMSTSYARIAWLASGSRLLLNIQEAWDQRRPIVDYIAD